MTTALHHRRHRRRGAHAVEFAIVAPIMFAVVFAIMEYGCYTMARHQVALAAREGARLAAVNTDVTDSSENMTHQDIVDRVKAMLAGQQLSNLDVDIYRAQSDGTKIDSNWQQSATYQQLIGVEINADYAPFLPLAGFLSTVGAQQISLYGKALTTSEGQ